MEQFGLRLIISTASVAAGISNSVGCDQISPYLSAESLLYMYKKKLCFRGRQGWAYFSGRNGIISRQCCQICSSSYDSSNIFINHVFNPSKTVKKRENARSSVSRMLEIHVFSIIRETEDLAFFTFRFFFFFVFFFHS